ncbi:hypothetical protein F3Y22_tig00004779pilonHSYRG00078 [Hibiscus syriacus]|uniref:Reverse transcriptase domain-containing protein n=1 Tax=Hibiscus syriacus TaxID=106335 RepID=A0A6A3CFP7_HIBSY|nr:hypothetical protein F3Y22_tig00004779pilonHSYRG00078 [Hibiscus syriacus]
MRDFQDVFFDLDLIDHPYYGPSFTWSNKQQNSFLTRKLDRVLANSFWVNSFLTSHVEFLAPGISDHCLAMVWLSKDVQANRLKPFKFFNFRSSHLDFMRVVQQSWSSHSSEDNFLKEILLQTELKQLEDAENLFLRQKAKIQWLKEGDRRTKFFHSAVALKYKRDTIRILIDDQGNKLETFDSMSTKVSSYFCNLVGSVDSEVNSVDPVLLKELLNFTLTEDNSKDIVKAISEDEIKKAFFSQGNDKSPGPDGYTPYFFKFCWSIISFDVIVAINFFIQDMFLQDMFLFPAFNVTSIVLVPKIPGPCKVKDFRPIFCCSVVYKAISKILVSRLTNVLPDLVTLNQTAFIKGRSIIDNTLLAQELVRGYGRKTISPRCSLKVDLHKAFDTLNWDFISSVLKAIGLSQTFITWIELCYSTASYSVSFNGTLVGFFKGAKGIRQGDPLSPLLFVLSMNVLSKLLNLAATREIFGYHPKCKKMGLTHLSFADDILIFCKGNTESVIGVNSVLDMFYKMSGLKLNASKCELFDAGMTATKLEEINLSTGFKNGSLPSVIKKIEQLCSRFFWKGADQKTSGARVSWNNICYLKLEGGEGSLWVAWIKCYIFKDKDFWNVDIRSSQSWGLRKLLKLRQEARPILDAGNTTITTVWDAIRVKKAIVPWQKIVWFPMHIPKHSLISWMALLDRLPTRERLNHMGLITDCKCILCDEPLETRDHIFMLCPMANSIWKNVFSLSGLHFFPCPWDAFCARASNAWKGKSMPTLILKLSFNATIYLLWDERNKRMFQGNKLPSGLAPLTSSLKLPLASFSIALSCSSPSKAGWLRILLSNCVPLKASSMADDPRAFLRWFPRELVRESPVIVLLDLGIQFLHPPDFEEELEFVYGFEVGFVDELHLGEEDVAAFLSGFAGEDDEETASFLVGLEEVLSGEVVLEGVKGDRLGSGGGGSGGGSWRGKREGGGGCCCCCGGGGRVEEEEGRRRRR